MASAINGSSSVSASSLRTVVDAIERQTADAMERLVAGQGFSELLVSLTENTLALSKISADLWDLTLRNLRLAGHSDINRLAHQMLRNEDKLELLLQAVERLESRSDPQ